MLKLLAMACVTHMLPKTYTKHTNTQMGPYHTHTMLPDGYRALRDPGTQASKTSNFVDRTSAPSPTTIERGIVRMSETLKDVDIWSGKVYGVRLK